MMAMEDFMRTSAHDHGSTTTFVKELETRDDNIPKVGSKRLYSDVDDGKRSSPEQTNLRCTDKDDEQLESVRSEMGEVREENERLKVHLDRAMKDYQTLQLKFHNINNNNNKNLQQPADKASTNHHEDDPFVSLSLGRFSNTNKDQKNESRIPMMVDKEELVNLGLQVSKSDTSANTSTSHDHEEQKEVLQTSAIASKGVAATSTTSNGGDDEVLHQNNPVKKTRVSVRARCDAPTMTDGCQWRKYGQKTAKGNPCPRAYYRCTVAPSCPVRKQVQRCADDMSILITTYEGTHNHQLAVTATAMASTTSAAASMLLSSSSRSQPGPSTTTTANLHGLSNYYTSNSNHYYSTSLHNAHPTVTLDLTSFPSSNSFSHHLNNRFPNSNYPPKFSSTSLDFSSSVSNSTAIPWGNNGLLSYGGTTTSYPYINTPATIRAPPQQQLLQDNIAAAITSDPSFQSALAAALTSIIGNNRTSEKLQPATTSFSSSSFLRSNNIGCATTYLNNVKPSSTNIEQHPASLAFLGSSSTSSLAFSSSRSASASPESKDQSS